MRVKYTFSAAGTTNPRTDGFMTEAVLLGWSDLVSGPKRKAQIHMVDKIVLINNNKNKSNKSRATLNKQCDKSTN